MKSWVIGFTVAALIVVLILAFYWDWAAGLIVVLILVFADWIIRKFTSPASTALGLMKHWVIGITVAALIIIIVLVLLFSLLLVYFPPYDLGGSVPQFGSAAEDFVADADMPARGGCP
jgi:hypothetical protein